jgi:hypothetical protein
MVVLCIILQDMSHIIDLIIHIITTIIHTIGTDKIMKKILLLLILSTNVQAETFTLDDLPLPNNINKEQWLKNNSAKPFNPNEHYTDLNYVPSPLKPLKQSKSNCEYGITILGDCGHKPTIIKPLTYDKNNKAVKQYEKMKLEYAKLSDTQKQQIINHFNNAKIIRQK